MFLGLAGSRAKLDLELDSSATSEGHGVPSRIEAWAALGVGPCSNTCVVRPAEILIT